MRPIERARTKSRGEDRPAASRLGSHSGAPAVEAFGRLQRTAGNRATQQMIARLLDAEETKKAKRLAAKEASDPDNIAKRIGHVKQRHGPESTATGAGKFNVWGNKIYTWIRKALTDGTPDKNHSGGYEFYLDCGEPTGKDINGSPTTGILVILTVTGPKTAFVNTAYPK